LLWSGAGIAACPSGSTYTTGVPSAATNAALKALNPGFTSYNQRSG
jgi:hypothetical protein